MILRILKNPTYIGVLEQGRVTTPSYKVKKLVHKPQEEWAVVPDHHEAIIDRYDFECVQRVLALDTRTCVGGQAVELFSGMVVCGECGAAMIRKTVPSGKKKYVYYVCAAHKNDKTCFSHTIRDTVLEEIVLELVKQHIDDVVGLSSMLNLTDVAQLQKANIKKLKDRMAMKREEVERSQALLRSLYESLADGIIDRDEYQDLKKTYTRRREEAEAQIEELQREMSTKFDTASSRGWIEQFRKHQGISCLDRTIVVSLVERILIYREHRVEVVFRWHDEYRHQLDLLMQAQRLHPEREAV